jgi:Flp pilus assembly protein TadG
MRLSISQGTGVDGFVRPKRRRGTTSLEFAVVAPVLFSVVLGIFEMGRGLMVLHLLTGAARVGCRAGILEGKSTADITTVATAYLSNVGINGDTATVLVNDGTANASTAQAGDEITVLVSVPVTTVTWVPGGLFPFGTLSGQFTMRRE